ncbi:fam-a protein, fragment [Plasmodium vinckei brucechwatti]|uniref:Fam-a protein n=1 Tax=Plasmodium vinckei brucechwatti TaxID=119398 RepID=A0A6V7RSB3_PLAVN|nr:fam-a protein, fragment [Plasmodium vinckei brucechwatti]
MHHIFGLCMKKPKKTHTTTTEPVKVKGKEEFDPKLPNINFIDEFDPITLESPKGYQSMLDELFVSETDGTITDKVTGFLRRENNSDEELDDEVESYLGDRENDGEGEENQG